MHRFFVEPSQSRGPLVILSPRESHHATKVLRIEKGERVVALDGAGAELSCQVENVTHKEVTLRVYQRNSIPPLPYQITLLQAIPRGKNMEIIVQKAAELGAHRVVPLLADRSVPHLDDEKSETKVEKWNAIAIDAIKQCGSTWLPKIELPMKPGAFLASGERAELSLIATLQPDAKHPRIYFQEFHHERKRTPRSILVWVGPEGDFTPAEINAIRGVGALPITLGELILRSETAAIYCLSVLNYELQIK
jgi:16S rRNA (uracil1498-N3)-methyltransferase